MKAVPVARSVSGLFCFTKTFGGLRVLNLFSSFFWGQFLFSVMMTFVALEVGEKRIDNWYAFELKLIHYFEL